jgi:hypothetical protein
MSADTFGSTPAIGNGATWAWVFTLGGAVAGGCAVASVLIALSSASGLPASAAWQQAVSNQAVAAFGFHAGASGQKLSFRIMGARNVEAPAQAAPGNIDLAVTACAPGGDAVLKAVIEPKDEGKENAVQRSL